MGVATVTSTTGDAGTEAIKGAGPAQLEVRGVTKAFPGCLANDDISFRIEPGEIHALLGENGAGKSTLVKIIYGVLQADQGDLGRRTGDDPKPA